MNEPLRELYTRSKLLHLDFSLIPTDAVWQNNIANFFEQCQKEGLDPRAPENRQRFNDQFMEYNNVRYAVSQYAEDRSSMLQGSQIAKENRVYHLGIDIFATKLEEVFAPCSGEIIVTDQESEWHSFGYFSILKPDDKSLPYIFFGHLGSEYRAFGRVKAGDRIAILGDYKNGENGGWSRHLHLQMLRDLPKSERGPLGYSSKENLELALEQYPDPLKYFQLENL